MSLLLYLFLSRADERYLPQSMHTFNHGEVGASCSCNLCRLISTALSCLT